MKVPEEANGGDARITFSFSDWPRGPVTPKTIEVALRREVASPAPIAVLAEEQTSDPLQAEWLLYAAIAGGLIVLAALLMLGSRLCRSG